MEKIRDSEQYWIRLWAALNARLRNLDFMLIG